MKNGLIQILFHVKNTTAWLFYVSVIVKKVILTLKDRVN